MEQTRVITMPILKGAAEIDNIEQTIPLKKRAL